jgi:hypothetical protein
MSAASAQFNPEQIEARRLRREAAKIENAKYQAMKKAEKEQELYNLEPKNSVLALAMATHPRLGADSPLNHEVFATILREYAKEIIPELYEPTPEERAELIQMGRDAIEADRRGDWI